jgi:predicted nicotinamide N-methyase
VDLAARTAFILENTEILTAPLVPEIPLHLASEILPLWQLTEEELSRINLAPPYWAFAWAGGQALARYILDHPSTVAHKRILDFATGSGISAIAAKRAGAAHVLAADIDPFSLAATLLNAQCSGVELATTAEDVIGRLDLGVDVILAGDVCYELPLAKNVENWLRRAAAQGQLVLMGDPGRTYMPREGLETLARYQVQTSRDLEDTDVRATQVLRVCA